jgi:hypothetical protein
MPNWHGRPRAFAKHKSGRAYKLSGGRIAREQQREGKPQAMRSDKHQTPARDIPQGVRRGELLPLRTLMLRLGIGRKTVWELERRGLRGVLLGKQKYFAGDTVVDFFARMAEETAGREGVADA